MLGFARNIMNLQVNGHSVAEKSLRDAVGPFPVGIHAFLVGETCGVDMKRQISCEFLRYPCNPLGSGCRFHVNSYGIPAIPLVQGCRFLVNSYVQVEDFS
jgi:hypothetical protein